MKRIILIGILTALILSAIAQKGWVITQKMESANAAGQNVTVSWYLTASHCKMKMEYTDTKVNSVTWFIPDAAKNQLLMYTEGAVPAGTQKTYFAIPVQDIKADNRMNAAAIQVDRTGETKTISGMLCEKMMIKANRNRTEMWVSKDFKTDYYKFYPFFQNSFELMGLNEEKIQGFPVSSLTKDNTGKVIISYQVISAHPAELTDIDFKVPSDYKSIEEITKGKN